jgi:hypothetical protein
MKLKNLKYTFVNKINIEFNNIYEKQLNNCRTMTNLMNLKYADVYKFNIEWNNITVAM